MGTRPEYVGREDEGDQGGEEGARAVDAHGRASAGEPLDAAARPSGYDERFLGPTLPLPPPADPAVETVVLPYTHFSVRFRPDRRLAASTAVAIDGSRLRSAPREDDWRLDPRLPEEDQAGEEVYRENRLDRGHLVRRLDPVWGTVAEGERANADTFHYTNAAPQMDVFNQGKRLWLGLEDFLLRHAARFDRKLAVFTGPVLEDSDPPYRGIRVPLRFWKVAAFMQGGELATTGYVLDQSPDLTREAAERAVAAAVAAAEPPPLGAFRTFQVPVADIARITGLDLGPLPGADLLPAGVRELRAWTELASFEDIAMER
ncbi:DNA/RNA non-specific endonuclease [Streptomyces sp. DSM 44917]|uniref:DNA/RNA non-specific endonuclease n=1 Tax=Streptomyces boetiae TaxID=3075541 RepID=A0ABU2LA07_9ACTN|nr:DNA/RNA non-specific endonuclease [Streptomyces sp. DSM 44917]MDT0308394.1 DNA/RNA non-specific endonuclease [Streptomyces sp. DSM 44917]